jgi:hypothetical protein
MIQGRIRNVLNVGNIFFVGILFLLALVSVRESARKMVRPNMSATAARARDIYVAISRANTEREPLGLPSIWPRTVCLTTNSMADLSSKTFRTSTEYFQALYDEANGATTNRGWMILGFDYSKCAGAGVKACTNSKLSADNNAWLIAANVIAADDDRIPLLITRNVDVRLIEEAVNQGVKKKDFEKRLVLGRGKYKKPFGQLGVVLLRKGGGTHSTSSRYATLGALFGPEALPPRDPSKPPIVYLEP